MTSALLEADQVVLRYVGMERPALSQVTVKISRNKTLGIVGESGSGKSSLARCLIGLETIEAGRILFDGQDMATFTRSDWRLFRRRVQMVFQDPYTSLNPRMTVGQCLHEILRVHRLIAPLDASRRVRELLDSVGLPEAMSERYPHELSGGQRQRVGIARALASNPDIIIADEPVSALDVSVQAQILNLLRKLVVDTGITLVMIAHDLAVVRYVCDDIIVMKNGEVVESGRATAVIDDPRHIYTKTLLAAVPDIASPPAFLS